MISGPAFSFVFMIVQMPNERQIKSRTSLETEEIVGELSYGVAQGRLMCSAIAVSAMFM